MKNYLKRSATYVFSIAPLALIILLGYNNKSANKLKQYETPVAKNAFLDLPCGYVSKGKQAAAKPTFVTNNYIPILQYPAGTFAGTTTQVSSSIYSEHQNDVLELQVDGNLVLYCLSCTPKKALWSTQTNGKDGRALFFQADGDLVLKNTQGKIIWHSNIHSTCAGSDKAYFTLQDDGNLAMLFDDQANNITHYLGGTGSTNDQTKMAHWGKNQ